MPEIAASNAARKKPSQQYSPAARIAPGSNVDRMLAVSGVVIACSSLAFAGYMVADVDRPPRIAGMEFLSIFARPNHSLMTAGQLKAPVVAEATNNLGTQSIDPTPTGSILDKVVSGRPVNLILTPVRNIDPKAPSSPYRLLDVSNGEALIENDAGFRRVRAGDILPDLGRINTIEKRGDHWVLLTQNGPALEGTGQSPITTVTTALRKSPPRIRP
jgi:hypothetical protein